jgi:hypothetical protein
MQQRPRGLQIRIQKMQQRPRGKKEYKNAKVKIRTTPIAIVKSKGRC